MSDIEKWHLKNLVGQHFIQIRDEGDHHRFRLRVNEMGTSVEGEIGRMYPPLWFRCRPCQRVCNISSASELMSTSGGMFRDCELYHIGRYTALVLRKLEAFSERRGGASITRNVA